MINPARPAPLTLRAVGLEGEATLEITPLSAEEVAAHLVGEPPGGASGRPVEAPRRLRAPLRRRGEGLEAELSATSLLGSHSAARVVAQHPAWRGAGGAPGSSAVILQRTGLDLAAVADLERARITAARLEGGAAVEGVTLRLVGPGGAEVWRGVTDAAGQAEAPGPRRWSSPGPVVLIGEAPGLGRAALPLDGRGARGYLKAWGGAAPPADEAPRVFLMSDRARYAPGEEAILLGVARPAEEERALAPEVAWESARRVGRRAPKMSDALPTAPLSPRGLFTLRVPLPEGAAAAPWPLTLRMGARAFTHTLEVEPVERAVAALTLDKSSKNKCILYIKNNNNPAHEPLALQWSAQLEPLDPQPEAPPAGFLFAPPLAGALAPRRVREAALRRYAAAQEAPPAQGEGLLLAGAGPLEARCEPGAGAWRVRWEVRGRDAAGGRAEAATTQEVIPWEALVGLRLETALVPAGEPARLEVASVTLRGAPKARRRVAVALERLDRPGPTHAASLTTDAQGRASWTSPPLEAGAWSARLQEEGGHVMEHGLIAFGAGALALPGGAGEDAATVVADVRSAWPAGAARLLIGGSTPDAPGEVTLERAGLRAAQPVTLRGRSALVTVPLDPAWAPNVRAVVHLRGERMERGAIQLPVEAAGERLEVQLRAEGREVHVAARRADGAPAGGAEVALLWVEDGWPSAAEAAPEALAAALHPAQAEGTFASALRDHALPAPSAQRAPAPGAAPTPRREVRRDEALLLPPGATRHPGQAEVLRLEPGRGEGRWTVPGSSPGRVVALALGEGGEVGGATLEIAGGWEAPPAVQATAPLRRWSVAARLDGPAALPVEAPPEAALTWVASGSPLVLGRGVALEVLALPGLTPEERALRLLVLSLYRRHLHLLADSDPALAQPGQGAALQALQRALLDQDALGSFASPWATLVGAAALQSALDHGLPAPQHRVEAAWRQLEALLLLGEASPLPLRARALGAAWLEAAGRPLPRSAQEALRREAADAPAARALLGGPPDASPEAGLAARWAGSRAQRPAAPDDALVALLAASPGDAWTALVALPLLAALPGASPAAPPQVGSGDACPAPEALAPGAWRGRLQAPAPRLALTPGDASPLYLAVTIEVDWERAPRDPTRWGAVEVEPAGADRARLRVRLGGEAPGAPGAVVLPLPEGVHPLPQADAAPLLAATPARLLALRIEDTGAVTQTVEVIGALPASWPTPALLVDGVLTPRLLSAAP